MIKIIENCKVIKLFYFLMAVSLVACGGGGDNAPAPAPAPAATSAAQCFDLGWYETTGSTSNATYVSTVGVSTVAVQEDFQVGSPTTFNGQTVNEQRTTRTETRTYLANPSVEQKQEFSRRDASGLLVQYGTIRTTGTEDTVSGTTTQAISTEVYNPPIARSDMVLAVGDSVVIPFSGTSTSSGTISRGGVTIPTPGLEGTPISMSFSALIKFVGIEDLTVPAGTFKACKFERTLGNIVTTDWRLHGNGLLLKTTDAYAGTVRSSEVATAVRINGVSR